MKLRIAFYAYYGINFININMKKIPFVFLSFSFPPLLSQSVYILLYDPILWN